MPNLVRLVLPALLLLLAVSPSAEQDCIGFAEALLRIGDYEGAVTEFERFIFMNPASDSVSFAEYRIAEAYRDLKQWHKSITALNRSIRAERNDSLRTEREILLAVVTAARGDFDLAEFRLVRIEVYARYPTLRRKAAFFRGVCCVYQARWADARRALRTAFTDSSGLDEFYHLREELDSLTLAAGLRARKDPDVAKWLSTFLPGSGQFYAGDWRNGLNALAVNSATGYFLVDNIIEQDWGDAVLTYLFLFGRYYFGNRYHAAESAREYNRQMDKESAERILELLDGRGR